MGIVRISGMGLFWSESCAPRAIHTHGVRKYFSAFMDDARRIVLVHVVAEGMA